MIKKSFISFFLFATVFALPLQEGDTCPNFTVPICENGEGEFDLYTICNGDENGGNYMVTWINMFTSW